MKIQNFPNIKTLRRQFPAFSHISAILLLLSIWIFTVHAEPDPSQVAVAMVDCETILLVRSDREVKRGWRYKVLDQLYGRWKGKCLAPAPPSILSENRDTLILLVPLDLAERLEKNKLRKRFGLPRERLQPHELFLYSEGQQLGILPLVDALKLPWHEQKERLIALFFNDPSSWQAAAAETILLHQVLRGMSNFDSTQFVLDAVDLLCRPFSPSILSILAEELTRQRPEAALAPLMAALDTLSLGSRIITSDVETYGRCWQVVNLLLSWDDPAAARKVEERLASMLEETIQTKEKQFPIASPIIDLYYYDAPLHDEGSSSTLASAIGNGFHTDAAWCDKLLPILMIACKLNCTEAGEILTLAVERMVKCREELPFYSIERPLAQLAEKLGAASVPNICKIISFRELRDLGYAKGAVEALGETGSPDAADTLITLIEQGRYRQTALTELAGINVPKAWQYAWEWVKNDMQQALSGAKTNPSEFESGAALKILASRANEIPEIEPFLIDFAYNAPEQIKPYAWEYLRYLPTPNAAEFLLNHLSELIRFSIKPISIQQLRHLSSEKLAPWLVKVIRGEVTELPDWNVEAQQRDYISMALMTLNGDTSRYATDALLEIAYDKNLAISLSALTFLEKRQSLPEPEILAEIYFIPRSDFNVQLYARLARLCLRSWTSGGGLQASSIEPQAGATVLAARLHEYSTEQLLFIAQSAAESNHPEEFKPILEILQRAPDPQVAAYANYGLARLRN